MRKLFAAMAFAVAGLVAQAGLTPAAAVPAMQGAVAKSSGSQAEPARYRRRGVVRHRFVRRSLRHRYYYRRPRVYLYASPVIGYRYSYVGRCGWLLRKYRRTGNRYWLRRYRACRY